MPLPGKRGLLFRLRSGSSFSAGICLAAFTLTAGSWFYLGFFNSGEYPQSLSAATAGTGISYRSRHTVSSVTRSGLQLLLPEGRYLPISTTQRSGSTYSLQLSQLQKLSFPRHSRDSSSVHHLLAGVLDFLTADASSAPPSPSPSPVQQSSPDTTAIKVAIISAVGLVLSVSVPSLVATFNRSRVEVPPITEDDLVKELRRRAEAAEAQLAAKNEEIHQRSIGAQLRDEKIERLENLLWSHGINPASALPVVNSGGEPHDS